MTRFVDGPVVEVSVSIDAPIEVVWDLVSDINLPAQFQDEFVEAEWLDEGPARNARFIGRNQKGERRWETTSWLVAYEPMTSFGWAVSDKDNPGATWTYFLEEANNCTTLRYHRLVGPGPSGLTSATPHATRNTEDTCKPSSKESGLSPNPPDRCPSTPVGGTSESSSEVQHRRSSRLLPLRARRLAMSLPSSLQGGQASLRARGACEPASAVQHRVDSGCFHFVNSALRHFVLAGSRFPPASLRSAVPPEGRTERRSE